MLSSEIAVLVRMNSMTEPVEAALAEAGIGYQVTGGTRFFSRREVRDADDPVTWGGEGAGDRLRPGIGGRRDPLGMGWTESPQPAPAPSVRSGRPCRRSTRRPPSTPSPTLAGTGRLRVRPRRSGCPAGCALGGRRHDRLPHAAKGMEWQAVFLIGLNEGVLPHAAAQTDAEVTEERRLFYVGITRASRVLEISYPEARSGVTASDGPRGSSTNSPRFAATPGPEQAEAQSEECPLPGVRVGPGDGGRADVEPVPQLSGDADVAVLAALQEWRTSTAESLTAERVLECPPTSSRPTQPCWPSPNSDRGPCRPWRRYRGSVPARSTTTAPPDLGVIDAAS